MKRSAKVKKFDHSTWRKKQAVRPCRSWRVQGMKAATSVKPMGDFDEIVVGHWLHVEMMDSRSVWMRIGRKCFWLNLKRNGDVEVTHTEDRQ